MKYSIFVDGWWWAVKRVSGKSGNAQTDVRKVLTKNGKRVPRSNKGAMREGARTCVWYGCTDTVAE